MSAAAALAAKIRSGDVTVGVIGLGYVGLPLARAFIEKGVDVLGFDVDPAKVAKLREGRSYIGHIDSDVVRSMRANGFDATADFGRLDEPDAILICVPTPLTETRDPDLAYVVESARAIAARLRPGQLVVLESTTYPGTTRDVVLPILAAGGLRPGVDFLLAYSPEREDPGNPDFSAPTIPKVVGGLDAESLAAATALYARIVVRVVPVSTVEVAEGCKILENTYRAVNIALVNELKVLYDRMGVDVWEVIEAAKTKPFGFQAFYPGPGLGGHCIPIDPFYLTWVARKHGLATRFIELAGEINTSMPAYVVGRIADALNDREKPVKGSRITILGMAYKRDVDDPRESPGFELMDLLLQKGADVEYNDPHIPTLKPMRRYPNLKMSSRELTPEYLRSRDCLLIATDHSAYDWPSIVAHASLIVDTRNALRGLSGRATIIRA
ncbi:nucleotide sugar dehydrogenase [Paludisphaera mucosa]|uniref:Nucleotide sugar dehydrogenase n=1 Tax=Paludisphaera mucosa TaxID=3030827 RepID=A0ABT6FCK6_9BACT|nr:nucleotide sugar dehydrogenase [Paludisphaera mucosa]MDG3005294.1 nucleotide sugar dehydrogenase [Paludisphaera mucosa]